MLLDDMTKWRDNLVVTGLSKSCPLLFFEDALDAYRNVSSRGNMPFTCKHGKMEMIQLSGTDANELTSLTLNRVGTII